MTGLLTGRITLAVPMLTAALALAGCAGSANPGGSTAPTASTAAAAACTAGELAASAPQGFTDVHGTTAAFTVQLTNTSSTSCVVSPNESLAVSVSSPDAAGTRATLDPKLGGGGFDLLASHQSAWLIVADTKTEAQVSEGCPAVGSFAAKVSLPGQSGSVTAPIPGVLSCGLQGALTMSALYPGQARTLENDADRSSAAGMADCSTKSLTTSIADDVESLGSGELLRTLIVTNAEAVPCRLREVAGAELVGLPVPGPAPGPNFSWTTAKAAPSVAEAIGVEPLTLFPGGSAALALAVTDADSSDQSGSCGSPAAPSGVLLELAGGTSPLLTEVAGWPAVCASSYRQALAVGDWMLPEAGTVVSGVTVPSESPTAALCAAADIIVSVLHGPSPALSSPTTSAIQTVVLGFRNAGAAPCTLGTFPAVALVGSLLSRTPLALHDDHDPWPVPVVLAPGARATSTLSGSTAGAWPAIGCLPRDPPLTLRVSPVPGRAVTVPLPGTNACFAVAKWSVGIYRTSSSGGPS